MSSADSLPENPHYSSRSIPIKGKWLLTQEAFDQLLNSFSNDREQAGAQYEIIRRKLARFFEWRGIGAADECADETINRVARKILEGQSIENLTGYFYGVARLVLKEVIKDRERLPVSLEDAAPRLKVIQAESSADPCLDCLDKCLESLYPASRQLILDYYQEERRTKIELRQQLADRLRIPLNALRIRVHRIRVSLELCITECQKTSQGVK